MKFETCIDYDRFKIEMRKIESDLDASSQKEKETSTKCQAVNQKPSELQEVKDLLTKMNDKIKTLEEKQEQQQQYTPYRGGHYRGPRHYRGNYNRGSYQRGRGNYNGGSFQGSRGQYKPSRPTGSSQFRPSVPYNEQNKFTCYSCGGENHIARNCPENK